MANAPIDIVVGLGNPGSRYQHTRHNVGFWFLDRLAQHYNLEFRAEAKFQALVAKLPFAQRDVRLLKPLTYMNHAGRAVSLAAKFYKVSAARILVVHDDLDLPVKSLKLKSGGGHGGHNGLRDIIAAIDSHHFWRLRVGIGHPGDKDLVTNYVLSPANHEQSKGLDVSLQKACENIELMLAGDMQKAMMRLHQRVL